MDLINCSIDLFLCITSPGMTCDPALYNSLIASNQDVIMAIYQDPTQLDLMR